MSAANLFLLSPAHCGGRRAATLLRPEADFDLAQRLRGPRGAELGEVFSFLSGLYFRGKLAYSRAFSRPAGGAPGILVISSGGGLIPPETRVRPTDIERFATVGIDLAEPRYTVPLQTDLERLAANLPEECQVILLGSIATSKYVEILLSVLGDRLCFPRAFVGVGDMARGAILLRAANEGLELEYLPARGAIRSRAADRKRTST